MSYARITLSPSAQALSVEDGETILDAALRAGLAQLFFDSFDYAPDVLAKRQSASAGQP